MPKRGRTTRVGTGRNARRAPAPRRTPTKRGTKTAESAADRASRRSPSGRTTIEPDSSAELSSGGSLRLGYVPGATPGKWARIFRERYPNNPLELIQIEPHRIEEHLAADHIDLAIARELGRGKALRSETNHAIPLYVEQPVVVIPRDHLLAATAANETITPEDLAAEVIFLAEDDVLYPDGTELPGRRMMAIGADGNPDPGAPAPRPNNAAEAVAWVASGAGLTVLPMSLVRLHHRKDVTYRPLANGPKSPVALVWPREHDSALIDDFIGVVRGRTANSSRR